MDHHQISLDDLTVQVPVGQKDNGQALWYNGSLTMYWRQMCRNNSKPHGMNAKRHSEGIGMARTVIGLSLVDPIVFGQ